MLDGASALAAPLVSSLGVVTVGYYRPLSVSGPQGLILNQTQSLSLFTQQDNPGKSAQVCVYRRFSVWKQYNVRKRGNFLGQGLNMLWNSPTVFFIRWIMKFICALRSRTCNIYMHLHEHEYIHSSPGPVFEGGLCNCQIDMISEILMVGFLFQIMFFTYLWLR